MDPEPGWTKKNGVSAYGYEGHIGVDEGTDLIRAATFTSANVHDSVEFEKLVIGDEAAVYADKGYPSEEHRAFLAEKGVKDGIMYKAARGKLLKDWQIWFNKTVAPIRTGVERIFARFTRARYFRLARNACGFLPALRGNEYCQDGIATRGLRAKCARNPPKERIDELKGDEKRSGSPPGAAKNAPKGWTPSKEGYATASS